MRRLKKSIDTEEPLRRHAIFWNKLKTIIYLFLLIPPGIL